MLSHVPITLSIAATGARDRQPRVVHAHDPVTPPAMAWLLSGSVAIGLLALIVTARALEDAVTSPTGRSPACGGTQECAICHTTSRRLTTC